MTAHKVLVRGALNLPLSAFSITDWDTDQPSLKARTVCAFKVTDWDNDNPANPNVIGFTSSKDEWS